MQPNETAARRLYVAHARSESGKLVQRVAELVERERLHVELDVGAFARGVGAREQAELRGRHGERAAAEERVIYAHACAAMERAIRRVQRLGALDLVDEPQLQMIL